MAKFDFFQIVLFFFLNLIHARLDPCKMHPKELTGDVIRAIATELGHGFDIRQSPASWGSQLQNCDIGFVTLSVTAVPLAIVAQRSHCRPKLPLSIGGSGMLGCDDCVFDLGAQIILF
jgi:hypothetical protein